MSLNTNRNNAGRGHVIEPKEETGKKTRKIWSHIIFVDKRFRTYTIVWRRYEFVRVLLSDIQSSRFAETHRTSSHRMCVLIGTEGASLPQNLSLLV